MQELHVAGSSFSHALGSYIWVRLRAHWSIRVGAVLDKGWHLVRLQGVVPVNMLKVKHQQIVVGVQGDSESTNQFVLVKDHELVLYLEVFKLFLLDYNLLASHHMLSLFFTLMSICLNACNSYSGPGATTFNSRMIHCKFLWVSHRGYISYSLVLCI